MSNPNPHRTTVVGERDAAKQSDRKVIDGTDVIRIKAGGFGYSPFFSVEVLTKFAQTFLVRRIRDGRANNGQGRRTSYTSLVGWFSRAAAGRARRKVNPPPPLRSLLARFRPGN